MTPSLGYNHVKSRVYHPYVLSEEGEGLIMSRSPKSWLIKFTQLLKGLSRSSPQAVYTYRPLQAQSDGGHWEIVADTWPLVPNSKNGWFNTNPFSLLEKNLNCLPTHTEIICPWMKAWHSIGIQRLRLNISTVRLLSSHLASLGPPLTQQPCLSFAYKHPTYK